MRLDLRDLWLDNPPAPAWLIPKIMVAGQLVVMAGDAGIGKSMLTLFLAECLAAGLPLFDQAIEPMNVLYVNEENSWHDMRDYVRQVRYGLELDEAVLESHLRIDHFTLTMSAGKWYDALNVIVREHKARLVIIDTATPACQIQDEDKNGEASVAITHLRHAMSLGEPGCGMLVLKHSRVVGKGAGRTIRGAKAWKGACDSLIFLTGAPGHPRGDGLRDTYLWPDKARAFGLRERVRIKPDWVYPVGPTKRGIRLLFWTEPEI